MEIKCPHGKLSKSTTMIFIFLVSLFWFNYTTFNMKIVALITSSLYSLLEFTWIGLTVELPNGEVIFRPFSKNTRKPETTWQQFLANVILLPFVIPLYLNLCSSAMQRIFSFPVLIWIIEIIEGYALILIYGFNPAWHYVGKDAFFHGNIKLKYFPQWIILGIIFEILFTELLINYSY